MRGIFNRIELALSRAVNLHRRANELQALTGYEASAILRLAKRSARITGKTPEEFLDGLKRAALKGWFGHEP